MFGFRLYPGIADTRLLNNRCTNACIEHFMNIKCCFPRRHLTACVYCRKYVLWLECIINIEIRTLNITNKQALNRTSTSWYDDILQLVYLWLSKLYQTQHTFYFQNCVLCLWHNNYIPILLGQIITDSGVSKDNITCVGKFQVLISWLLFGLV